MTPGGASVRSRVRPLVVLVALCLLATPLAADAGVLIVEKTTVAGGAPQTHQIQIDKDAMRVEHEVGPGEKGAVVFDGAKQLLWIVNYDKKSYTEMTKADVDRMGQQMGDATARVQEQLRNLPPDQRAQVEAMMKSRGMPGVKAGPRTTYRKVGTDTVGRWTCDRYEGYLEAQKTSELCTVDPKVLGLTAADFDVARKLADYFRQLMPNQAESMFRVGQGDEQGFSGVPVRRVVLAGSRPSTSEMTEVSRQTFAPSTFEVPAGFRKQVIGGR
jgi:hypothetical protein